MIIDKEIKKMCEKALKKVSIVENKSERIKMATEFAERLFVTDYLKEEEIHNFIKNELSTHFSLTEEETDRINNYIEEKEKRIKDKLLIAQLKNNLIGIEPFDEEKVQWFKGLNYIVVKDIVKYLKESYIFNNKDNFISFVKDYLCKYFELNKEEELEIMKGIED